MKTEDITCAGNSFQTQLHGRTYTDYSEHHCWQSSCWQWQTSLDVSQALIYQCAVGLP